jgi:hypothetical protein
MSQTEGTDDPPATPDADPEAAERALRGRTPPMVLRELEPDLLWVALPGDVSRSDIVHLLTILREQVKKAGRPIRLLDDINELGKIAPEARRIIAHSDVLSQIRAVGFFGGNFSQRSLAKLVTKGMGILLGDALKTEFRFFDDVAGARGWLDTK